MKRPTPCALLGVTLLLGGLGCHPQQPPTGVEVLRVESGYALARAGLEVGDRVTGWSAPESAGGTITSPFDFAHVERQHRAVQLSGSRQGRTRQWQVPDDEWRGEVRRVLDSANARVRDAAIDELRGGRRQRAMASVAEHFRRDEPTASEGSSVPQPGQAVPPGSGEMAELYLELGRVAAEGPDPGPAQELFERACELSTSPWWCHLVAGDGLERGNHVPAAAQAYDAALVSASEPAVRASLLRRRAWIDLRTSHLDDAIRRYGEAAEISRRLDDPTGEAMARILFGVVQLRATHLDEARQALEEAHRLAPADSALAARALNFLGQVAARRADQEAARRLLGEALELYDRLGVRDRDVGIATMELGILDWRRGDLAVAEKRYLRAREIFQSDPSQRVYLAWVVQNLALVAHSRGDLATAEDLLQRALTLRQRPDRKTYGEAVARFNLASLQIERENFEGARRQLEQAIEVIAERRPGSDAEAEVLTGLARVATEQDRFAAAEEYLARAETTVRQRLPQGFDHALVHYTAGRLELARGNPAAAEERFRREITIRRRIQPATGDLARALHALARVRQQRGDPAQARRLLIEAVEALEAQRQRLGGPHEALALFTDRYAKIYKDLIALLLDGGETAAAFRISERYRAQGLLALLASRELTFGKALPEPLRRQRQENARAYDAAQAALANLASSSDPALLAQHLDGLRELQRQRAEIDRAVWQQDDRLRHLEAGRAIAPDALVGLLPAGTLLVSFVVRDDELISFTLGADAELAAERSPIPRHQLGQRVERFQLLNHHRDSDEAARRQLAQDLWSELFSVWQERLADADRLLVIADGPLHRLPFAALLTADGHYAIESWGLQQVVSATVLAELAARPARPANRVVAFADPTSTTIDGRPRPPLPAARREARGLARRFPGTTVLTGRHASEPAAKALPTTANWLHFACHARIDHRFPLDSYLALAPGRNGDNGLLQAWEVFEEMRLESDLVVLSACDSGGGRAVDGDGTIGLTRAFHFAGARSVLATQWPVADGSTADLMDHFYSALEAGASPVEALRRAQRDFLTGQTQPSRQHPFYWAGFQLFGPG